MSAPMTASSAPTASGMRRPGVGASGSLLTVPGSLPAANASSTNASMAAGSMASGGVGVGSKPAPLVGSFSLIEHPTNPHVRFLIMDCPTDTTIPLYLKELARLNVTDVVRVCQPTYDRTRLLHAGIEVHDWPFKDGDVPSTAILKQWLTVVARRVAGIPPSTGYAPPTSLQQQQHQQSAGSSGGSGGVIPMTIAVHCVAGLGRAPVLVAVALIDSGLDPIDAIEKVRRRRRGAFNSKQINFLADGYKKLKLSIPAVVAPVQPKQQAVTAAANGSAENVSSASVATSNGAGLARANSEGVIAEGSSVPVAATSSAATPAPASTSSLSAKSFFKRMFNKSTSNGGTASGH